MMKKRMIALIIAVSILFSINPANIRAEKRDDAIVWVLEQVGKSLDYDNVYGARSVDLIKWYYSYFGVANYALGDACSYKNNILPPGWERLYGNYQPGDVVVWKTNHSCETCTTNDLGHVGIVTAIEENGFYAVSQSLVVDEECSLNYYNLNAIDCVLRPKYIEGEVPFPEQKPDVYLRDYKILNLEETNVKLEIKVVNLNKRNVTGLGCRLYDNSNKLIKEYVEGCNYRTLNVNYWCDFNLDMKYTLMPGTAYVCQLYTIVDGVEYRDEFRKFTTKGGEQIPQITHEPTASPKPTPTASPEPTPTASPEPTPTASPEPTPTASPEPTPTASPEPTPTASPEPTPTASPEATPTASPEPTPTASPELTPTVSPEPTPTASPTQTPVPFLKFNEKLNVSSVDNKNVRLTWKGNTGIEAYKVYRSTKKNGKYKCIATLNGDVSKYIDKNVKPLKNYYYLIKACYYVNQTYMTTEYSNISKIQVTGMSAPKVDISLKKGKNGCRYIVLKIKKYSGKYFEIYVKQNDDYKKVKLTSNKLNKKSVVYKLKYVGTRKKVLMKIRTYREYKNKKIYSMFSKEKTIKVR